MSKRCGYLLLCGFRKLCKKRDCVQTNDGEVIIQYINISNKVVGGNATRNQCFLDWVSLKVSAITTAILFLTQTSASTTLDTCYGYRTHILTQNDYKALS